MLKREALQILDQRIGQCTKCTELTEYRQSNGYMVVPGVGNPAAKIMVIGEAPGENEAKEGIPFCGKAGKLLTNILLAAGFSREAVFISNILKCRPPKNREPLPEEACNCLKYLELQIKIVDPEWILCFGRTASVYVLGRDTDDTIGSLRGKVHDRFGRKVICTYHPSYVLRQLDEEVIAETKAAIWDDLQPLISSLRSATESV